MPGCFKKYDDDDYKEEDSDDSAEYFFLPVFLKIQRSKYEKCNSWAGGVYNARNSCEALILRREVMRAHGMTW